MGSNPIPRINLPTVIHYTLIIGKKMICAKIAYEITPADHPIVKDGKFLCRYCKLEMLPTTLYGKLVWIHKQDM